MSEHFGTLRVKRFNNGKVGLKSSNEKIYHVYQKMTSLKSFPENSVLKISVDTIKKLGAGNFENYARITCRQVNLRRPAVCNCFS